MSVAAEIQGVVGAENVRLLRLGMRRLLARLEAAERLVTLLLVDVKPVVGKADRLHRRLRRGHIGEEVEQAAHWLPSIRGVLRRLDGRRCGLEDRRSGLDRGRLGLDSQRGVVRRVPATGSSCHVSGDARLYMIVPRHDRLGVVLVLVVDRRPRLERRARQARPRWARRPARVVVHHGELDIVVVVDVAVVVVPVVVGRFGALRLRGGRLGEAEQEHRGNHTEQRDERGQ